ncbi:hypothetical protein F4861DRAFT_505337, partial [Xylaria intraflava]
MLQRRNAFFCVGTISLSVSARVIRGFWVLSARRLVLDKSCLTTEYYLGQGYVYWGFFLLRCGMYVRDGAGCPPGDSIFLHGCLGSCFLLDGGFCLFPHLSCLLSTSLASMIFCLSLVVDQRRGNVHGRCEDVSWRWTTKSMDLHCTLFSSRRPEH